MVRINLLPREILERRKWERWYPYVFIAGILGVAIVLVVFGYLQWQMGQKNGELQSTNETVSRLTQQSDAFAIFEQQQQQLQARQQVSTAALAGRVDMGRLAEEVSLILPDEVWISRLAIDQSTGLQMDAFVPASTDDAANRSYKAVAKTLVRLGSLEQLYDVWLTNASTLKYSDFYTTGAASQDASLSAVGFSPTAKVVIPASATASSSVPAPPSTPGQ